MKIEFHKCLYVLSGVLGFFSAYAIIIKIFANDEYNADLFIFAIFFIIFAIVFKYSEKRIK